MSSQPTGEQFVTPTVVAEKTPPTQPPQRIVLEQPGGWFGKFGKILLSLLAISVLINISQQAAYHSYFGKNDDKTTEKFHSLSETAKDKVAIILVEGAIISNDGFIKDQIDRVRNDENVKAVVLRINSPGGTVTASDYLLHHLQELTKERKIPLVVSMGSLCASGGYYMAMAVGDQPDSIYAEPATWTGSIGVIIPHYDASNLLEAWHVKDDSIASHKFKQLGSPTRKLDEADRAEERKILQSLVDESFANFKDVVRSGRPIYRNDSEKLDAVATGQVFTAKQAQQNGLVDKIGFIEDAINRAIELAALSPNDVRVVKYKHNSPGLLGALEGEAHASLPFQGGFDLEKLLDMTAPRAYYLSTWLPTVLSNSRP